MIVVRSGPSKKQASKLMFWCINVVRESLLTEISCIASHSLDQTLRCTKIPIAEAWWWVHVSVNDTSRDVVALISSASQSYGFHVANWVNDTLHRLIKMLKWSSDSGLGIRMDLFIIKGRKIFRLTGEVLFHSTVLVIAKLVASMLSSAVESLA